MIVKHIDKDNSYTLDFDREGNILCCLHLKGKTQFFKFKQGFSNQELSLIHI